MNENEILCVLNINSETIQLLKQSRNIRREFHIEFSSMLNLKT